MRRIWVAIVSVVLAACSPSPDAGNASPPAGDDAAGAIAKHPVSGLKIIPLTVVGPKRSHSFRVELANTPAAQARGLMFRTEMDDDEGMLFPSETPEPRSFWMKNTPLSLDIIFIGVDGRISNIAANTTPYSLESVLSEGAASAVLELRGGRAAELGIAPGDRVEYRLPQ